MSLPAAPPAPRPRTPRSARPRPAGCVDEAARRVSGAEYGTELGRLFMAAKITPAQYQAGHRWNALVVDYYRAIGAPMPLAAGTDAAARHTSAAADGEDPPVASKEGRRLLEARRRIELTHARGRHGARAGRRLGQDRRPLGLREGRHARRPPGAAAVARRPRPPRPPLRPPRPPLEDDEMITIVLHPPPKGKFTYGVELDGEMILTGSSNPEYEAARVMLARGMPGPFQTTDATGKIRMTFTSIEETAKWTIEESDKWGPRLVKYRPFVDPSLKAALKRSEGTDVASQPSDAFLRAR